VPFLPALPFVPLLPVPLLPVPLLPVPLLPVPILPVPLSPETAIYTGYHTFYIIL